MDLRKIKVKVKDKKHAMDVQRILLKQGARWVGGSTKEEILRDGIYYLRVNSQKIIFYGSDESVYNMFDDHKEVDASKLINNKFNKLKDKLVKRGG